MIGERRTISERIGVALASGDLRQKDEPCALDKVGALGMVGITESLADAVFRLKYANDHHGYADALEGVRRLSRRLDTKNGWRLSGRAARWMSKRVLHYWISDLCPTCCGVGYQVIGGSPHLSDRVCQSCKGTRKRPMPWVRRSPRRPEGRRAKTRLQKWRSVCRTISERASRCRLLLVELEKTEQAVGEKMIAKLASEIRAL